MLAAFLCSIAGFGRPATHYCHAAHSSSAFPGLNCRAWPGCADAVSDKILSQHESPRCRIGLFWYAHRAAQLGGAGAGRGAANSEAAPKLAQLNLAAHGARRAAAARGPGNPANAKCSDRILAAQRAFATFSARAGWTRAGPSPPCTAARQAVPDPLGGCAQHPGPWVGWQVSSRALTHGQRRRPPGAGALGRPLGAGPQVYSPRAAAGPSLCCCTDKARDGSAAVRRALPVVPLVREHAGSSCPRGLCFRASGRATQAGLHAPIGPAPQVTRRSRCCCVAVLSDSDHPGLRPRRVPFLAPTVVVKSC